MKAPIALAILCLATAVAAGAGAGVGEGAGTRWPRTPASAWATLRALRNLTPTQKETLRDAVVAAAQKTARDALARLQEALAIDDAERAAVLAVAEAAGADPEAAPGLRSIGGDGDEPLADTLRRVLREGLPSRDVPPLDPFRRDNVPIDIDIVDVLRLQGNLEDLSVEGLADFQEDVEIYLGFTILPPSVTFTSDFNILVTRLRLLTQYEVDGYADVGLGIWGDGLLELVLNRLRLKGTVNIRATISSVLVEPCDIALSARSIRFEIEGLFGGGLLSQLVGEIITEMFNEMALDELFGSLTVTIQDGVCGYLRTLTVTDLIGLVTKITSMPLPDSPPDSVPSYNQSSAHFSK